MSLDVFVVRPGVTPPVYFGHLVRIPPVPSPEELRAAGFALDRDPGDALEDALFADALAGLGRPARVVPYGLVEATPWERRFVSWCSRRLGCAAESGWDAPCARTANAAFASLAVAIADPLAAAPSPVGGRIVSGDDLELEALGAAREVREWLQALPVAEWPAALDGVLVLLPAPGPRRALWRRTFERHGIPAEAPESVALSDAPIGRWLVSLTSLAGWASGRRVRREELRNALLAPHLSMPEGARRSDVRACIRGLRAHSIGLQDWSAHVACYFAALRDDAAEDEDLTAAERRELEADLVRREQGLASLTEVITRRLADERAPFSGLSHLLDDVHVGARVRASRVTVAATALDRASRVVAALAREPADEAPPTRRLEAALARWSVRTDVVPVHGARVMTYAQYDGRAARLVVLAGLEEGGWPIAPPRRSRDEELVARSLQLLGGSDELVRQARVAAAAASCARERVVLAWSRTDEAGSTTFAGPLLAAVRGPDDAPRVPEIRVGEARCVPADPSTVQSPAEVLHCADPQVGAALAGDQRARWDANARAAAHACRIDAARAPGSATPVGPYNGVVGVPLGRERYSPTALEALGQCPTRYLFERVLGIEERTDAGVDLEAAELGSLLHTALAACAQDAIRKGGAWQLSGKSAAAREAHVERVCARVERAVDGAVRRYAAAEPTLSSPLIRCVSDRWKRALRRWLEREAAADEGGLFASGGVPRPADLTDEQLAALDDDTRALIGRARSSGLEDALALLAKTRKAAASKRVEAERWYASVFADARSALLPKGEFVKAAIIQERAARHAALDGVEATVRENQAVRDRKATEALRDLYAVDRLAVPRRVVASEWSFGDAVPEDADPKSTERPLVLSLPGATRISIRGRVDRVDGASDRPDLVVVDYKTGRSKTGSKLRCEVGEGRHLQLPIYAAAVERLLEGGVVPANAAVVAGRLDYPRDAKEASLVREDGLASPFVPYGGTEEHAVDEALAVHLAHAIRRLAAGVLPMLPRACPNEVAHPGYCNYGEACDYRPEAREQVVDPDPQPLFVDPPGAPKQPKAVEPTAPVYPDAAAVPEPPSSADGAAVHAIGRQLARDVSRNVVLAAGAGSGKTTALVDRYVRALEEDGCAPGDVLCITFTRKATAEMRARVRTRLLAPRAEPDRVRQWIAGLSCAPIHTIDAFAGVLVKELDGEAAEVADGTSDVASEFVADRLAAEAARPSRELALLLESWPLAHLRGILEALVARERGMEEAGALGAKGILAGWNDEASRLSPGLAAEVKAFSKRAARLARSADEKSMRIVEPIASGLTEALEAIEKHGAIAGVWALRQVGVNFNVKVASEEALALRLAFRDWLEAHTGWFGKAAEALAGCESAKEVTPRLAFEAELSAAALEVATGWRSDFRELRRARGLVTFGEVLDRATALAGSADPADLAARFPFRHVLVDEFQDTDGAQLRFVDALVSALRTGAPERGCKLFVVGDPKQSIYRFRGAEVDLFEERCSAAGSGLGELTTCFRSEPALTRAVDRIFSRLLAGTSPNGAPLDPAAAVPWKPLSPRDDEHTAPLVELVVPDDAAQAGDDESADEELRPDDGVEGPLVRRIRALLAESAAAPARDEAPVALLTHSWDRAVYYGQLLRTHGVPAFVQGGRGLLDAREIRDLFHWLVALERQDDDLSFAALLRGGSVGVSDPGLYCLRQGHGLELRDLATGDWSVSVPSRRLSRLRNGFRFDPARAVAALEKERGSALPSNVRRALENDAERLRVFGDALETATRGFGHLLPLDVLDGIVAHTGYEAALRARPARLQALANLRAFRDLVRTAQAGAAPGEVVRELQRLTEAGDDPAAPGLNLSPGEAVLVTVVHQAKGREWDYVVVPDLHRKKLRQRVERCDPQRLVHDRDGGVERRWIPSSVVESEKDLFATEKGAGARVLEAATRGAERAESRRLLYVACTRARKRLVLGGRWPDATKLTKWMSSLGGSLALPFARSWMEDVAFALQFRPDRAGRVGPSDVWREGRDFAWVSPPGSGFGEPPPSAQAAPAIDPERVRAAARTIEPIPLRIVNPSSLPPDPAAPRPTLVEPGAASSPLGPSPFGSADEEGTAFHRALQLWSYSGPCSAEIVRRAVRGSSGDVRLADRTARIEALVAWQRLAQPALVAELEDAAARGQLHHEVAVGYAGDDGSRVEGSIDLLYRGADGAWHVVDYKTSRVPDKATLQAKIAEHHGQVRAYADAVRSRLSGTLGSYALWFVSAGIVARWGG